MTIEEDNAKLDSICLNTIKTSGKTSFKTIPKPRLLKRKLLEALVQLPKVVADYGVTVSPRKKLVRHLPKRHMAISNESEVVSIKK